MSELVRPRGRGRGGGGKTGVSDRSDHSEFALLVARYAEQQQVVGFSPRTVESYGTHLAFFGRYLACETDIEGVTAITPEHLHAYQTWLYSWTDKERRRRSGRGLPRGGCTGHGLSMATQGARLSALRAFFKWLVATDVLLFDPAASLVLPKRPSRLPRTVLSRAEVARLLSAPAVTTPLGLRDRAVLELLYSTGLRNAEVRSLAIYDLDLEGGLVRVRQGKNARDRMVPLGRQAAHWLHEYLTESRPRLLAGHTDGESAGTLFLSKSGRRLRPMGLIEPLRRHAHAAGITRHVTPHSLRHTFATHLLAGGADIRHIQVLLGHASVATTQIYTRVEITDLKAVHRRCHPREVSQTQVSRTSLSGTPVCGTTAQETHVPETQVSGPSQP